MKNILIGILSVIIIVLIGFVFFTNQKNEVNDNAYICTKEDKTNSDYSEFQNFEIQYKNDGTVNFLKVTRTITYNSVDSYNNQKEYNVSLGDNFSYDDDKKSIISTHEENEIYVLTENEEKTPMWIIEYVQGLENQGYTCSAK